MQETDTTPQGMVHHIEALKSGQIAKEDFEDDVVKPSPLMTMSKFVLDGQTLHLPNVKAGDPLMYRIEALRMFLSEELGEQRFVKVYRKYDIQKYSPTYHSPHLRVGMTHI